MNASRVYKYVAGLMCFSRHIKPDILLVGHANVSWPVGLAFNRKKKKRRDLLSSWLLFLKTPNKNYRLLWNGNKL